MPNRIIKESICTSPNVDMLSRDAEVFFYRLLVQCDDFGRMDARRAILRARCYPLQIDRVREDEIGAWLTELSAAGLIGLYIANGCEYLHVQTWDKHQQVRAKRSKYPEPPTGDSNRNHLIANDSICPRNPIQSNPNPILIQPDDDEWKQALSDMQVLGLWNKNDRDRFADMWPELTGRHDWVGKAITLTRDKNVSAGIPYVLKVLANAIHTGKEPGYVNGAGETPKPRPSYANPEALERSRRIEECALELATQGITQDTDHMWLVKLDDLIEAKYGYRP